MSKIINWNEYIAGAIGGASGIVVGHPFDTAKIQMQIRTTGDHRISRTYEAWSNVVAQGMKGGMFRGMMFPLLSYGVTNSMFFGMYGNAIRALTPDHTQPTNMQIYMAGCFAGMVQLCLSCPVEVIKCTMQSQIPMATLSKSLHPGATSTVHPISLPVRYYRSPWGCLRGIFGEEGVRGLYKGLVTMFIRDVPSNGLYLLIFESLYYPILEFRWADSQGITAAILAGGIAGCGSWAVAMPFDVIKSRLQVDHGGRYEGFVDCFIKSVRNAGFSVLFRGTTITMLRAFPVNAVTLLVFSQTMRQLNYINPPDPPHESNQWR